MSNAFGNFVLRRVKLDFWVLSDFKIFSPNFLFLLFSPNYFCFALLSVFLILLKSLMFCLACSKFGLKIWASCSKCSKFGLSMFEVFEVRYFDVRSTSSPRYIDRSTDNRPIHCTICGFWDHKNDSNYVHILQHNIQLSTCITFLVFLIQEVNLV